jgi:imidazolonepropionase
MIIFRNARVLTMGGKPGAARGVAMGEGGLGVLARADVVIDSASGLIREVRAGGGAAKGGACAVEIDASGRVLMPGFVDCHTHALWAGSRVDEWEMRLRGATYQEIAAKGGGILSTVRAVRGASDAELDEALSGRLDAMLWHGTTTAEVKSGYGLTLEHELRMLEAIDRARLKREAGGGEVGAMRGMTVVATALLGHAIDLEHAGGRDEFVRATIEETLAAIARNYPGIAVDAFCEGGAWTREECVRLFERAKALGCPVRVHADQFASLGMVGEAVRLGARSVDHMEASIAADVGALGASKTFAVALPCCGFHLDGRYADGRRLVDAGAQLCIATNYNPGSAPCPSMATAIALAARHCGLTSAEAITAATRNPAALLGFTDRGYVAAGARADLVLLCHRDERALAYEFGANPVEMVICAGRMVSGELRW